MTDQNDYAHQASSGSGLAVTTQEHSWWWIVVPLVLGALAVAPLVGRGGVFLLDWVVGPRMGLPRVFWGLDGGMQGGMPFYLLVVGLRGLVGSDVASWLPLALFFPLAGWSMGNLVGGGNIRRVAAAVLYTANPLVFDRLWVGQFAFLFMYAVLPLFVAVCLRKGPLDRSSWGKAALLFGIGVACTPHTVWIFAVALAVVPLIRRPRRRAVLWAGGVTVAGLATNVYLAVSSWGRPAPVVVGASDLVAYRTQGNGFDLYLNVATLSGFWRTEPRLPKDVLQGAPIVALAILILLMVGARRLFSDPMSRRWAAGLLVAGLAGFVLALGDRGPFGPAYRAVYDAVGPFRVMREPQKFVVLLALSYACLFGYGVEAVFSGAKRVAGPVALLVAVAAPLAVTPTVLWGLGGSLRPASFPPSWRQAEATMGEGEGKLLFLPWHLYLAFPFTERVVSNPAPRYFSRDVISGDNVELAAVPTAATSPRSRYLESLYARGSSICNFGELVAPLGIEYVAVARAVDFARYGWLAAQQDLERVPSTDDLVLYRNVRFDGIVNAGPDALAPVTPLSQCDPLPGQPRRTDVGYQDSPVSISTRHGSTTAVALAEPFDPGWKAGTSTGEQTPQGTVGFRSVPGGQPIRFAHWSTVRAGFGLSLLSAALLTLTMHRSGTAPVASRATRFTHWKGGGS